MESQAEASLNAYTNDDGDFAEVVRSRIAELNARIEALDIDIARLQTIARLNYFFAGNEPGAGRAPRANSPEPCGRRAGGRRRRPGHPPAAGPLPVPPARRRNRPGPGRCTGWHPWTRTIAATGPANRPWAWTWCQCTKSPASRGRRGGHGMDSPEVVNNLGCGPRPLPWVPAHRDQGRLATCSTTRTAGPYPPASRGWIELPRQGVRVTRWLASRCTSCIHRNW